ncbi:hypothetical protein [Hoeflea ulvae]|uniref:DUF1843 domain-containing protein n=1 Tax=Hoeflea ulvae TaxID=2983764 RepID=A0ABT3YDR1_9HYPH|nr:hypothetical protein [Hoeflea ulvae]MCY0093929.1 hypothetical protein [Hoeflea ulvae]
MASQYDGPVIMPLYGVAIRAVAESGDKDLMKAMLKVSDHLMSRAQEGVEDWRAAHDELAKAAG